MQLHIAIAVVFWLDEKVYNHRLNIFFSFWYIAERLGPLAGFYCFLCPHGEDHFSFLVIGAIRRVNLYNRLHRGSSLS